MRALPPPLPITTSNIRGNYPFMHAMANQWVVLTGPDSAQGRCYLLDWATQRKTEESPLLLLATYADEYARIEGTWYISRTRLDIVWPKRNVGGGQVVRTWCFPTREDQTKAARLWRSLYSGMADGVDLGHASVNSLAE